jgi:glycosyltransferase involved in cell wall biosynthesis
MIFRFLNYLSPIWYFNLKSIKDFGYFATIQQLIDSEIYFEIDSNYINENSQNRDIAWTAFQQGFINKSKENGLDIWNKKSIPIHDEYVFLRKNFHKAWVLYVLIIRIITFNNPFREFRLFVKTRKIKRVDYSQNHIKYKEYDSFESPLIKQNPLVSIIIPTLNRYEYLKDVFRDLENQTYKNFEVIVVDQTDDFQESFYKGWKLDIKFWFQEEKALWKARNEAIKSAKGDYILLYDDDSLVENDWIFEHLKTIDFFGCYISSGVSISAVGDEVPKHYSYFRWSDQIDTGNVLLKKEIFKKIGLFDTQFEKQRMGDCEFGLRSYLAGFSNVSNHKAKRIHLKVSQGGLRQMGSWDGWRPKKLFGPRPVPSVLYLTRNYFGNNLCRCYILKEILPSLIPYRFKKSKILKLISFLFLPFVLPLVLFQVIKSWNLASEKLKEGAKIEEVKVFY